MFSHTLLKVEQIVSLNLFKFGMSYLGDLEKLYQGCVYNLGAWGWLYGRTETYTWNLPGCPNVKPLLWITTSLTQSSSLPLTGSLPWRFSLSLPLRSVVFHVDKVQISQITLYHFFNFTLYHVTFAKKIIVKKTRFTLDVFSDWTATAAL